MFFSPVVCTSGRTEFLSDQGCLLISILLLITQIVHARSQGDELLSFRYFIKRCASLESVVLWGEQVVASNEWVDSLSLSSCSPGISSRRTVETDINSPRGQPRGCRASSREDTHGEEVKGAFQVMPREGKEKEKECGVGGRAATGLRRGVQGEEACDICRREYPEEKGEKKSVDGGVLWSLPSAMLCLGFRLFRGEDEWVGEGRGAPDLGVEGTIGR